MTRAWIMGTVEDRTGLFSFFLEKTNNNGKMTRMDHDVVVVNKGILTFLLPSCFSNAAFHDLACLFFGTVLLNIEDTNPHPVTHFEVTLSTATGIQESAVPL